ncbi:MULTISPECIES: hypothetical protein [unclassified Stenotrophomonas]|nr:MULTISPECIES: hypothetical protein [unclassified Stenotrophomonas]MDV3513369.1 hypothetical protein [Stenotrophomonas sp. C1657]
MKSPASAGLFVGINGKTGIARLSADGRHYIKVAACMPRPSQASKQ